MCFTPGPFSRNHKNINDRESHVTQICFPPSAGEPSRFRNPKKKTNNWYRNFPCNFESFREHLTKISRATDLLSGNREGLKETLRVKFAQYAAIQKEVSRKKPVPLVRHD